MAQRTIDEQRRERALREQQEARVERRPAARHGAGWWALQGAIGGLLAGLAFAMFEMIMAAVLNGAGAFFMPLRMIGAIVLGAEALAPSYSLLAAGAAGLILHMLLSVAYGALFGLAVHGVEALRRSTGALLLAASAFGFLLWVVNFYGVAPLLGWTWFPEQTNAVVQFIAHTFFYGTALGLYLRGVGHRDFAAADRTR